MVKSVVTDSEKPQRGGLRMSRTVAQKRKEVSSESVLRDYFKTQARVQAFSLANLPERITDVELPFNLTAGLHLFAAPASGGKTLTGLGLAVWLDAVGVPTNYVYAYEPLSPVPTSQLNPVEHAKLLKKHMGAQPRVLVFDSLTLALRMLPEVKPMADIMGDQAYPGGLKPADLAGAALHNDYATTGHTALLATVNSDMLPIVKALPGAIMGIYQVPYPGTFVGVERSDRLRKPIVVPYEYMNIASLALGYGTFRSGDQVADNTTRV
jgi:hypothetical protein